MVKFNESQTKVNLMKAFAGESQARNRYTFAASIAKKEKLTIIEELFTYTADQERAHAWEFMKRLKEFSGEDIEIIATYPAEVEEKTLTLLRSAQKHEAAEHDEIYKNFAEVARKEGFEDIAILFEQIASVEIIHSRRFARYADQLANGTLFKKDKEEKWICTNCGYIYEGTEVPKVCPLCKHPQGYFILFEDSNFE